MDKWQELTIEVNREVEEAASNILIESGSQGVAIDDSADYLENADRFGELYPEVEQVETVKITAYYPESADIEAITKQVNERLAELTDFGLETGDIHLATQELVEEDWAENWKKYYEPARITHDLTIVPSWTDYEASVTSGSGEGRRRRGSRRRASSDRALEVVTAIYGMGISFFLLNWAIQHCP